jgi:hypothetical protein
MYTKPTTDLLAILFGASLDQVAFSNFVTLPKEAEAEAGVRALL